MNENLRKDLDELLLEQSKTIMDYKKGDYPFEDSFMKLVEINSKVQRALFDMVFENVSRTMDIEFALKDIEKVNDDYTK